MLRSNIDCTIATPTLFHWRFQVYLCVQFDCYTNMNITLCNKVCAWLHAYVREGV